MPTYLMLAVDSDAAPALLVEELRACIQAARTDRWNEPHHGAVSDATISFVDSPDCVIPVTDESAKREGDAPLPMRISRGAYGLAVEAVDDAGYPMGEVYLDYFDNTLKALIYGPGEDEPAVSRVLVADVAAARGEDHGPYAP